MARGISHARRIDNIGKTKTKKGYSFSNPEYEAVHEEADNHVKHALWALAAAKKSGASDQSIKAIEKFRDINNSIAQLALDADGGKISAEDFESKSSALEDSSDSLDIDDVPAMADAMRSHRAELEKEAGPIPLGMLCSDDDDINDDALLEALDDILSGDTDDDDDIE